MTCQNESKRPTVLVAMGNPVWVMAVLPQPPTLGGFEDIDFEASEV